METVQNLGGATSKAGGCRPGARCDGGSCWKWSGRRWCMNTVRVASPPQACALFDADGDRHTEAGHSVERVAGDFRFGPLIGQSPGMKRPADDRLVAIHRRPREPPPAISRAALPADAAVV